MKQLIIDVEKELNWFLLTFTCMVYPGETFEDGHEKIMHSLTHFPYQIHSSDFIMKERTGDWGHLMKATVNIGLLPGVELDEALEKFNHVVHLQQYEVIEKEPVKEEEKELVGS